MIPPEFDYMRPHSIDEAVTELGRAGEDAKVLAGGQSLLPLLRLRLAYPTVLVDLGGVGELRGVRRDGDELVIGSMTTHHEVMHDPLVAEHCPLLAQATSTVADPAVRHRGTFGGALSHADPAGDLGAVALALDAQFVATGPSGERTIPAADFWVAYRRTALEPDELILRVRIPVAGGREARFRKIGTRRAQAISKVVMALAWRESDGGSSRTWSDVRLALGSVADRPIRVLETEAVLEGAAPTPETADEAAAALASEISPIDDVRSTADYRRAVAARVLYRLIRDAGGW